MTVAIYIAEGSTQLVLTPETDWEKAVILAIDRSADSVKIERGGFYECQGGWYRESGTQESLILRTKLKQQQGDIGHDNRNVVNIA